MAYWLFKSEPKTFGIDHLKKMPKQTEHWDGVRNYQARNFLRDSIQKGDQAFFYHSNCKIPGITGIMSIVKPGYPDDSALNRESDYYDSKSSIENPRWFMVDVKFKQKFSSVISLERLKQTPALQSLMILRPGNRLSITPVTDTEWHLILALAKDS
jgi:predicted RNA-binding protein with PUA-like domain